MAGPNGDTSAGTLQDSDQANVPAVSIIVPAFNAAPYIAHCIRSALSQDLEDIEVICIDDCSSDATAEIIRREAADDSRVKPVFLSGNAGAPAARNRGIEQSSGEYLLFMDADDSLFPGSLRQFYSRASEMNSDAIKGSMLVSENGGQPAPHHLNQARERLDTSLRECPEIQHMYQYQSYLFRSSLIRDHAVRFNERLKNFQDPVFLSHLLPLCRRIDVLLPPLYIRNIVPDSIITSHWKLANYTSLVEGVDEAHAALQGSENHEAARDMTKTFSFWWHKLALMPESLSRDECFEIFAKIKQFSDRVDGTLADPVRGRMAAHRSLLLISEGRFDAAYRRMRQALVSDRRLPKPVRSLIELSRYAAYKWFGPARRAPRV